MSAADAVEVISTRPVSPTISAWQVPNSVFKYWKWAMYGYLDNVSYIPLSRSLAASQSVLRRTDAFLYILLKVLSSRRRMIVRAGLMSSLDHSVEGRTSFMYLLRPRQAMVSGS